ncbi:UNVERIFIED_CONTAM: cytochrome c biogenesis protein CcdC [Bacillus cereus]
MIALLSSVVAVCMAVGVMFLRFKAAKKPVTKKKIILPPIFMSTGAMMYFLPEFRLTSLEIVEAISIGLIFSIFLIKTTKFEIKGEHIFMKPSKAFIFILVGLLAVRVALKSYLSGMFFLLAFAMIVSWRIAMYRSFTKLEKTINRAGISI